MRIKHSPLARRSFALLRLLALLLLPLTIAAPAFAQKAYVRDDLASTAIRLEETLRKSPPLPAGRQLSESRTAAVQLAARNPRGALSGLASVIAAQPRDAQSWLAYARTSRMLAGQDQNNAWQLSQNAMTAAYVAYQRATTRKDEADALAFIGAVHQAQQTYRPALNAYRASLDIQPDPALQATYEKLRAEQGFRVLEYKVDSDASAPRVCFQFSEPLASGKVDYAPFIAVSGAANGAISKEDQQLCVEGLKHGERYAIVLRQGLPSSVGEDLLKSADYEIYVRDRSPRVRFTGKNYVLPRVGQEGVPVVSVNTDRVAVDVLRIGDRNLLPTVRSDDFLTQLGAYRARKIIDETGLKIWSGTLDVRADLNKDVITAFPVTEAIGQLQPGVYVMVARAGDKPISVKTDDDEESYSAQATQWFVVSDLGLTSFSGEDGVHAFVRSLATAEPVAGVELRLIARNNEILATQTTDANGYVRFAPGLSRGTGGLAPGLLAAAKADDYGFLDLVQTPFDLTDRGVKGRAVTQALDAYVYPERGVYRSGETVNVTALLRDARGLAVAGLPVTLVVKRPDGVEYRRVRVEDQGLGGRAFSFPLLSGAATGGWKVQAYADPKSPAIGEAGFLVEDYVPERLDVTLTPQEKILAQGQTAHVEALGRYLYGAPGAGLVVTGELVIEVAKSLSVPGLTGFTAGLEDEAFEAVRSDLDEPTVMDARGRAVVDVPIPDVDAPRPVEAKIVLRTGEPGGRAVERVVTLPVRPKSGLIAVRKNFSDLGEGAVASFDVAAVSPDGVRVPASNLRWSLSRITNEYQWYNSGGSWGFERVKATRRLADGRVAATAADAGRISAAVTSGTHRLDITSEDGTLSPTSVKFNVGWSGDASADTPDLLEVTLDKQDYVAGDEMKLRITSRFAGKANVVIVSDKVQESRLVDVTAGDTDVSLPVKAEWGAGAYAVAFVHRPLDQQAKRMPGRALGLAWFDIDRQARNLTVDLGLPEKMEPRRPLSIPVRLGGLTPGEEAHITLAAVDVGILSLTRYEPPNGTAWFFGQKQLTSEIRDLYGLLIDGMQGTRGAIRSGGDGGAKAGEGNRPTQEPLARYSGVVKVGDDGVAHVTFDIPAFNGSVRVMAVAWSKTRVGQASKDVIVRDQVVVQATTPRFLTLGDASRFHLQIDNVEAGAGDYTLALATKGPVSIAANALTRTLKLDKGARTQVSIPVTATALGTATVDVKLTGPGFEAAQTLAIGVQPGSGEIYRRVVRPLPTGQSVTISNDLFAEFIPGTGAVSVAVSPFGGIDVPALLQALDRYPYGCSEQTVSRAMPLLYVNKLASQQMLAMDGDVDGRVNASIERVLSRQDSSGAFGLWSSDGAGNDLWLDAFVTDFLTRAREAGYAVPQRSFEQAVGRLRNQVVNAGEVTAEQGPAIAYALYVLARNGRPVMGDLRYLADTRLASFETVLARAQLGAALALLGDRSRAQAIFASAGSLLRQTAVTRFSRADYGSRLRDSAGLMALAAEADIDRSLISTAGSVMQQDRAATSYVSTQEMNWMVLAASALSKDAQAMNLSVGGQPHSGALYRKWTASDLSGPVAIANDGAAASQIVITTSGHPAQAETAITRGYQVERSFFGLDGKPKAMNAIRQNDRFVVILKVTEVEAAYGRLLLVDHLPAGLEIDNPSLFEGGSLEALAFAKPTVVPVTTEYRDDRFVAAFERNGQEKATFNVAYIVRAVTPGRYVYPPVSIEDMYRPDRFGRSGTGALEVLGSR